MHVLDHIPFYHGWSMAHIMKTSTNINGKTSGNDSKCFKSIQGNFHYSLKCDDIVFQKYQKKVLTRNRRNQISCPHHLRACQQPLAFPRPSPPFPRPCHLPFHPLLCLPSFRPHLLQVPFLPPPEHPKL